MINWRRRQRPQSGYICKKVYMRINWNGVYPAVTTKFTANDTLDLPAFGANLNAQVQAGVNGIIIGGSLGEASTLAVEEKEVLVKYATDQADVPVLMNI